MVDLYSYGKREHVSQKTEFNASYCGKGAPF